MAERRKLCLAAVVQFVTFVVALDLARQCGAASSSSSPDAKAMWDLARALSGLPSSWKSGSDPCDPEWEGVTCSAGRVSGISLGSRGVSGTLPASLSALTSLASLRLHRNRLSGPVPLLSSLSSLQTLFLDGNAFDSLPDTFFAGLSALQEISLDDLPLAPWSISHNLSAAVGLADFSASNSSLSGTLPDFLGSLLNLRVLRLSYNQLTGSIPSSLAGSGIQQLLLNNQQDRDKLSGSIDVLGAMPQLTMVWLQSNSFTGPIPDLSNVTALESFNVRDNALTGVVPPSLTACLTLKNATLSNNLLQGPFPQFASKFATLDVGTGNQFCTSAAAPGPCDPRVAALLAVAEGFGYPAVLAKSWKGNEPCGANWLGVTCDAQKSVTVLNFASQHFGGVISPAFANFTSLRQLHLSNNDLTGSIPDSLTQLPQLQVLDVTNNNLSGKMPSFSSSVTLKLEGNPKLGTDSGSSDGSSSGMFGSSPGQFGGSKAGGMIAGIVVAMVVLVGCLAALFLHRRKKKQEEKLGHVPTGTPPNEPELINIGSNRMNANGRGLDPLYTQSGADSASAYVGEAQGMYMSIQNLRKATNNFSEENILGRGGFGVVYKGDHNGTLIAVKRNQCDVMGKKGNEEFKAEIDVLRKVRHRNLVALLGYCDDGQERLLVYEYMSGGTLGEHLFEWQSRNEPPLTWKQRLTIVLDVARGIEYLHSLAQESFIHRDLKPSNILLDKDLRAKVSDFGLVKLAADNQKSMMTRLAGTFGYLAPEYATTGKVSTKIDVYAFGVILMELITGRKVLDESLPPEDCHLVAIFRRGISHEKNTFLNAMVDQVLELDEEDQQSLAEVADLAWHCTGREPYQRPDMSHAVNKLSPLVDQWKPTTNCTDEDDGDDSSMSLTQRLERWQRNNTNSATDSFGFTFK
ncbi:receptor-like kinase TMK4 [Musa acuminata AAA Group]|uniref:receptor-like kinase TMK4 n=1 Tax=Musa acuminata AAA Group TaxID=214697 RepID=UPI0031DCE81C